MFNLGGWEWIIIVIIAILLFGSQAPKLVAKFFNTTKEIKDEIAKGVDVVKGEKKSDK